MMFVGSAFMYITCNSTRLLALVWGSVLSSSQVRRYIHSVACGRVNH